MLIWLMGVLVAAWLYELVSLLCIKNLTIIITALLYLSISVPFVCLDQAIRSTLKVVLLSWTKSTLRKKCEMLFVAQILYYKSDFITCIISTPNLLPRWETIASMVSPSTIL